jgi:GxxExxY protein
VEFDSLSTQVIGCAIEVHRVLGPGLLESTYEECLSHELSLQGLVHQRQLTLPVTYKGLILPCGYRVDLLVDGQFGGGTEKRGADEGRPLGPAAYLHAIV